jgi:hypothetical protein
MSLSVKQILLLLAIVGIVIGCENFYDDDDEYIEAIANVESMRVDTVVNRTATITVSCATPTPCWNFSRITDVRDSNIVRWTVHTKVKKNITCIQMVGSFKQTLELTVPAAGIYTLKIYRTPTTTMDTTITFN